MAQPIPLEQREVQSRKKCILYMLFDFLFDHRGQWRTYEDQDAALSQFLATHDARRTVKIKGSPCVGQQHTTESLRELIRKTVRLQADPEKALGDPVNTFFNYGHRSVKRTYYEDILRAWNDAYPLASIRDLDKEVNKAAVRTDSATQRAAEGASDALREVAAPGSHPESTDDGSLIVRNRKEVCNLHWSFHGALHEGLRRGRKRYHNEIDVGVDDRHMSRVDISHTRSIPDSQRSSTIPVETQEHVAERRDQKDEGFDGWLPQAPTIPLKPVTIEGSRIRRQISSIDNILWAGLRSGFRQVGLDPDDSVRFPTQPCHELDELYQSCFGPAKNWKCAVADSDSYYPRRSLDFFVGLIGTLICSKILLAKEPLGGEVKLTCGSTLHDQMMTEVLDGLGIPIQWLLATTAAKTARSDAFLKGQIQPHAGLMVHNLRAVLQEHLSSLHSAHKFDKQAALPDIIANSIAKAFEVALLLKAELDAVGDSIEYGTFRPGQDFFGDEMHLSIHAYPMDDPDGQAITMAYLPCIYRASRNGERNTISPAIVMLA